jgi:hypothetical protein
MGQVFGEVEIPGSLVALSRLLCEIGITDQNPPIRGVRVWQDRAWIKYVASKSGIGNQRLASIRNGYGLRNR